MAWDKMISLIPPHLEKTSGERGEEKGDLSSKEIKLMKSQAMDTLLSRLVECNSLQPHGLCSLPGSSAHGMEFSRQEYWCGVPFPIPTDLPDPGIEPESLMPPTLVGRFFTTGVTCEANRCPRRPSIPNLLFQQPSFLKCHHPSPSRKLSIYV